MGRWGVADKMRHTGSGPSPSSLSSRSSTCSHLNTCPCPHVLVCLSVVGAMGKGFLQNFRDEEAACLRWAGDRGWLSWERGREQESYRRRLYEKDTYGMGRVVGGDIYSIKSMLLKSKQQKVHMQQQEKKEEKESRRCSAKEKENRKKEKEKDKKEGMHPVCRMELRKRELF